ncbi:MAG: hypothetical protein HUJ26_24820 [Planctomycetaceae bacterium]|nr:hypothetical protein [Planctomycetaceae bacterium]
MSESYQLLIDHDAELAGAPSIGQSIIDTLISERIILPEAQSECVLTGVGYPPGPRLRELYDYGEQELRYWDMLRTIGVKLHTDRYVNFFGFPVFEESGCPECDERFSDQHVVMDAIYDCVSSFINDDRLDNITCPSCAMDIPCDQWVTVPDIGFCHVAVEFWNWPSFASKGWKISMPDLLSSHTGRVLAHSWGHM